MKRHLMTLALAVALTLVAGTAWAYWSAGSVAGGGGAAAASSVNQGATPTASATGSSVTVSWSATTLSTGRPVSGYLVKRYAAATLAPQTVLTACTGTLTSTSCVETNVPNGSWKYAVTPVFAASWLGPESAKSATVVVNADSTAPTSSLSLSSVTGGAYLGGTTVYYRGAAAGSVRLTNAVADAGSGPASSATAALGGTSTGWTHTPSTVSAPSGGPYVSNPFSWAAGTTSSPTESVTGRDVGGNTVVSGLTFVNDSTPPTAGTINYVDGLASGRSVSVNFTSGTDAGSGIATRRLQRAVAPLANGACGTFGGFTNLGPESPASPYVDGTIGSACYKYRYVVTDNVGNQSIATSTSVVKVGYAAAVNATTGVLSYWRLGEQAQPVVAQDTFTDDDGTYLRNHTSATGLTWTHQAGTADALITDHNRVRRGTPDLFQRAYTVEYANLTPASADYSVQADLHVLSNMDGDMVGVVGRLNPTTGEFYLARWEESNHSWNLYYCDGPTDCDRLDRVTNQPDLDEGETYQLRLQMTGNSIRLYVNGTLKASDNDSRLSAAGRAGIMDGNPDANWLATNKNDSTGVQLDDFQIPSGAAYPRAADDRGNNPGDYTNGVTLGVAGAIAGDPNTAAQFDGVNDYVQMTGTTGIPVGNSTRSVEAWFKTTSTARQVIFDYGNLANTQEFGLWINQGGAGLTAWGYGGEYDKVFPTSSSIADGNWHQVVATFNGTTLTIYIDGVALPTQTTTRNTQMDGYGFSIGAVINPSDINSGGWFNGSIDDVSLYTTVLNQATVTAHYELGGAPSVDTSGPTGGSVDASGLGGPGGRYAASTTLSLALAAGTDPNGLATSGNQLLRATAPLADGSCGSYGSYGVVADDPASPASDTVADGACYRYQYVVGDTAGNLGTFTSPDIKVDVAAPAAPALSYSSLTNAYWAGSGPTVYYRSGATSGSVRVTAAATSPSGIASYTFPTLGSGWTATPGATGVTTYSWSAASPAAPGTKNVTATNGAGTASASAPITLTADNAAPTGNALTYLNGSTTSTTVSVSLTTGTDAGSGLGTRLLQRATATVTSGNCGTFGAYATVTNGTNPTATVSDSVTANTCYQYRYVVSDNVANQDTVVGTGVVKVIPTYATTIAGTGGLVNWWRLGEAATSSPADDAKGNNNGTYTNSPTVGVAGAIAGDSSTAVQLDGNNDYVSATRTATSDFSVEFWFRSTQGIGSGTSWLQGAGLVSGDLTGSANDYGVSLRLDGKIVAGLGNPGASVVSTTGGWNDGNWHHVVFTRVRTGGALTLYVDGAAEGTVTGGTQAVTGSTAVSIGRNQGATNYLQGSVDEVAIYNTALSLATVGSHYATGTTP